MGGAARSREHTHRRRSTSRPRHATNSWQWLCMRRVTNTEGTPSHRTPTHTHTRWTMVAREAPSHHVQVAPPPVRESEHTHIEGGGLSPSGIADTAAGGGGSPRGGGRRRGDRNPLHGCSKARGRAGGHPCGQELADRPQRRTLFLACCMGQCSRGWPASFFLPWHMPQPAPERHAGRPAGCLALDVTRMLPYSLAVTGKSHIMGRPAATARVWALLPRKAAGQKCGHGTTRAVGSCGWAAPSSLRVTVTPAVSQSVHGVRG